MGIILKIGKIGKVLPRPIKKRLRGFYRRWANFVKLDRNLIEEMAECFNISQKEVIWLLQSGERLGADLWHILNPKTKEEIQNFYKTTPFYIFELACWHMTKFQREFHSEIIKSAKGKILDFGGGIGNLCLELARWGFNVDYADLSGLTFNFAKWLFQKRGHKINMIDLSQEKISKEYDTIFCIDVIEHVTKPKIVLENLTSHLRNNGRLIITGLNIREVSKVHPMHFKMEFDAEKYLNSLGLFKTKEPWLWVKSQRI